MDFLSRYTRNVWTLTFRGYVDRLREVLRENAGRSPGNWTRTATRRSGGCPDDDAKAMAIVELLLAAGVDPAAKNRAGRTAADWARQRGMIDVARRLGFESRRGQSPPSPPPAPDLAKYEGLAQDLVFAFETGRADSMARLKEHFGGEVSWEDLRKIVRRRLEHLGEARPEGYFALAHARTLIAAPGGVRRLGVPRGRAVGSGGSESGAVDRHAAARTGRTCRSRCGRPFRCGCTTARSYRRPRSGAC